MITDNDINFVFLFETGRELQGGQHKLLDDSLITA